METSKTAFCSRQSVNQGGCVYNLCLLLVSLHYNLKLFFNIISIMTKSILPHSAQKFSFEHCPFNVQSKNLYQKADLVMNQLYCKIVEIVSIYYDL